MTGWRGWLGMVVSVVALAAAAPVTAQDAPRIALIVTNQNYSLKDLELKNTHRDGDVLKAALEAVGFDVRVKQDIPHRGALEQAVGEHVARLANAGPDAVGFFYYSGHGAADGPNGRNYLLPTQAQPDHAAQLPLIALSVEAITSALAQAGGKMSFVVFDACRNVPLQRADKVAFKGLAPYREEPGLLVAYATQPGDVAADENLYARALSEELVKPGAEAGSVFRAVSRRVFEATGRKQRPDLLDRRFDDFVFQAGERISLGMPEAVPPAPPSSQPSAGRQESAASGLYPFSAITTTSTTLRREPRQLGEAVRQLAIGEPLTVTSAVDGEFWYMAREKGGVTGYIRKDEVKRLDR